jgi:nucleoside-diphosphate-sugar epimerase
MHALGWRPKTSLRDGLGYTYDWVAQQVRGASGAPAPTRS